MDPVTILLQKDGSREETLRSLGGALEALEVDMRELAHNVSRARASSVSIHAAIQDSLSVRLTVEGETFRSRAIAATPSP